MVRDSEVFFTEWPDMAEGDGMVVVGGYGTDVDGDDGMDIGERGFSLLERLGADSGGEMDKGAWGVVLGKVGIICEQFRSLVYSRFCQGGISGLTRSV